MGANQRNEHFKYGVADMTTDTTAHIIDVAKERAQVLDVDSLFQIRSWCELCATSGTVAEQDQPTFQALATAIEAVQALADRGETL